MSPKKVDKQARRESIVEAAVRVFARQGFAGTRVSDVAGEADVAQGTIYLYFASREEILGAAFEAFAARMDAGVRAAHDTPGPALHRLRAVVRAVLATMAAEADLARVMLDFWSASTTPGPIDLGAVYARYREVVADLLAQGQEDGSVRADLPSDTPAVLVGAIEGGYLQWIVDPRVGSPADLAEPLLDVLVGGIGGGR